MSLMLSEVSAQSMPEEEEAVYSGSSGIRFLFVLIIALPIAAVAIIAVWILRKKRLIF